VRDHRNTVLVQVKLANQHILSGSVVHNNAIADLVRKVQHPAFQPAEPPRETPSVRQGIVRGKDERAASQLCDDEKNQSQGEVEHSLEMHDVASPHKLELHQRGLP
jgi:hypothetical protein